MVKVGGRSILHWQLDALAAAGVDDVVIVRGYLGDAIAGPAGAGALRFIDNPEWANNNILASLFFAAGRDGRRVPVLVLGHRVRARHMPARSPPPAAPRRADRRSPLAGRLQGRTLHPVSEAELARVEGSGETVRPSRASASGW